MTCDRENGISRWLINGFIVLFLLLQITIPASYYLSGDPSDERFSWRMFARGYYDRLILRHRLLVAQQQPGPGHRQPVQRVALQSTLPQPWIIQLQQRQPNVLRKYLQWQSQRSTVDQLFYVHHRVLPDGQQLDVLDLVYDVQRGVVDRKESP